MERRQIAFVQEYLKDKNATQAAIRAGYSAKTARINASKLLAKANIREAVEAGLAAQAQASQVDAKRIVDELTSIAFAKLSRKSMIRAPDKIRALELLAKRFNLFTDSVQVNVAAAQVIIELPPNGRESSEPIEAKEEGNGP